MKFTCFTTWCPCSFNSGQDVPIFYSMLYLCYWCHIVESDHTYKMWACNFEFITDLHQDVKNLITLHFAALILDRELYFACPHQNWMRRLESMCEESRFLLWLSNVSIRICQTQHGIMDPPCLLSKFQAASGGITVWQIISWYTLGPYWQQLSIL